MFLVVARHESGTRKAIFWSVTVYSKIISIQCKNQCRIFYSCVQLEYHILIRFYTFRSHLFIYHRALTNLFVFFICILIVTEGGRRACWFVNQVSRRYVHDILFFAVCFRVLWSWNWSDGMVFIVFHFMVNICIKYDIQN